MILMDVQMPVMGGDEATQKIRNIGYRNPIIMQTANVMADEVALYKRLGAEGYISKPINKAELYELMEKHLSKSALTK